MINTLSQHTTETLLMLLELSKENQEIAKIVAFEGGFELLFSIMEHEGMNNGRVVVQDCLQLMNNLLRDNVMNQNHFREMGCIERLPPLLTLDKSDMWILTDDKTAILTLTLNSLSLLVSPANSGGGAYNNQTKISQVGLLDAVLHLALGGINSPVVRTKALWTLGDVLRGHPDNCRFFEVALLPTDAGLTPKDHHDSNSPNGGILAPTRLAQVLFLAKVHKERRAALHSFVCYLFGNEEGQHAVASTLTPPPDATGNVTSLLTPSTHQDTVCRQLVRELMSWDTQQDILRPWFASLALCAVLQGNAAAKDILLKVPINFPADQNAPVEILLTRIIKSLIMAVKTQADVVCVQMGILRLLAVWLDECDAAVRVFLQQQSNLSFLMEIITQPKSHLHVAGMCALIAGCCFFSKSNGNTTLEVVLSQIDRDAFIEKLNFVRQSTEFKEAEDKFQHENLRTLDEIKPAFYDYDFTIFFKTASGVYFGLVLLLRVCVAKILTGWRCHRLPGIDKVIARLNPSAMSMAVVSGLPQVGMFVFTFGCREAL
jgi:hypothetical protein